MKKIKIKTSTFIAFTKAIVVLFSITVGLASFTKCNAQSVVGKWKSISEKTYYTAQGAKTEGKQIEESSTTDVFFEYKSDHTFTSSPSANEATKENTFVGTWELKGDQLKTTTVYPNNKLQSATFTVSIMGNTMIQTGHVPPNPMVSKMEFTYIKM